MKHHARLQIRYSASVDVHKSPKANLILEACMLWLTQLGAETKGTFLLLHESQRQYVVDSSLHVFYRG